MEREDFQRFVQRLCANPDALYPDMPMSKGALEFWYEKLERWDGRGIWHALDRWFAHNQRRSPNLSDILAQVPLDYVPEPEKTQRIMDNEIC